VAVHVIVKMLVSKESKHFNIHLKNAKSLITLTL